MKFFDRISQEIVESKDIVQPVILSRFLDLNNHFIVPCINLNESISDKLTLEFSKNRFINNNSSLIANSFIEISHDFSLAKNISDIEHIDPMLRNFDKRLEISEYDIFIHENLFHLEEVCRQPAYHLSRDVTKVNVSRAKRIPVRSINYLAAHSEDWARRRIRGVEPKNILAETIEYDLQIYENKVTSKLIDKLLQYCNNRITNDAEVIENFIKKAKSIMKAIANPDSESAAWYKKRERDYRKFALIIKNIDNSEHQLSLLKEYMRKIQNRLFSLFVTPLYLSNKNTILSSDSIERTNLFDSHQHYRYIKIIWNESFQNKALDCVEIKKENIKIIKSFIDFSYLLVIKSLIQLGFKEMLSGDSSSYQLSNENYTFDVVVKKDKQAVIHVEMHDKTIKFIALLNDEEQLITKDTKDVYYLVPYNDNNESNDNIIKINSDDINSEERITKIIFKYILELYVGDYLFHLDSQLISQFGIIKDWLLSQNDLVINLGEHNKLNLHIKRFIGENKYIDFERKIKEQKNNLPHHQTRKQQEDDLKDINKLLLDSQKHFSRYFTCLGCGTTSPYSLEPTVHGFIYSCKENGCGVSYGNGNKGVFYNIKNIENITGDIDDKVGYENIDE